MMNQEQLKELVEQLEQERNGDKEHDREVLMRWLENYRGDEDAEPLLMELGRQLYLLDEEDNSRMIEAYWEEKRKEVEEAEAKVDQHLMRGNRKAALDALEGIFEMVRDCPLPDSCVWMDFDSLLDGMVFQDYYSEEIAGREIVRHPLHPASSLYRYGHMLLAMGLYEEAHELLSLLVSLDPVCPKYMLELCEVYKKTGNLSDAYDGALWTLECAATSEQMAACYRLIAYCLEKNGEYQDAIAIYKLSLSFQSSPAAEAELAGIRKKNGSLTGDSEPDIAECCERLGIPMEISENVRMNQMLLKPLMS